MVYEGKEYNTFGEIFDKAVEVAKEGQPYKRTAFMDSYLTYIITTNRDKGLNLTVGEARNIARSNFGYFSGYHDKDTEHLIYESYLKVQ